MAIWKDQSPSKKEQDAGMEQTAKPSDARSERSASAESAGGTGYGTPRRAAEPQLKESVVAAGLTIEGKIEGSGHVCIAGSFKGDVNVKGDLTIEAGAKVTGGVQAQTVTIGGELEGNIDAASRVEILSTGMLNGDLKAASLIVAAGSRMRGQVEFGWDGKSPQQSSVTSKSESASESTSAA